MVSCYIFDSCKDERLDVIIFGASGFSGKRTVREAVNILKDFRWGVAGRNKLNLKDVLDEIGAKTSKDLSKTPIFVANTNDQRSLYAVAQKGHLLVNCCGPFDQHGEAVVKACIESGTHYVDISCEPSYIESIHLKYDAQAKEKNVYIVLACGFPSMALDIGINFIRNKFEGTMNIVDAYTEFCVCRASLLDPVGGSAAWASLVSAFSPSAGNCAIRCGSFKQKLAELTPRPCKRKIFHRSPLVNGVNIPFPVIGPPVVEHSQRHFYNFKKLRPVQFHNYVTFPSIVFAFVFFIWCFVIALLARFKRSRDLVIEHPKIFSFGLFREDGPLVDRMEQIFFRITLSAVGWSKVNENPDCQFSEPADKHLVGRVSGMNPLYGSTCVGALTSAVIILMESDKMPESGGVFSPGAAFAGTNIITELEKEENGIVFDIEHTNVGS